MTGAQPSGAQPAGAGSHLAPPSAEEMAAIAAAVEVAWPRPSAAAAERTAPAWRFSGRWWRAPVATRRERPHPDWSRGR